MSAERAVPDAIAIPPVKGGRTDLVQKGRKRKQQSVVLSDGKEYTFESLRPREIAVVNRFCLNEVPKQDPDDETEEQKYEFDVLRPFYLVAKAMIEPDGKRSYKSTLGEDTAYIAGGQELADYMEYADVQVCLDIVNDISGLSQKARDAVGKSSGSTRKGGS